MGEINQKLCDLIRQAQGERSQNLYASQCEVSSAAITKIFKGTYAPSAKTLKKLAAKAHNSVTYQMLFEAAGYIEEKDPVIQNEVNFAEMDLYPIPLVGRVVAGMPIECEENLEGYVFINHKPKEEYFALRVFGDSMINAGIPDGAILIVHKQPHAENGNIVIAFLNGEQTVKYLKFSGDDMYLVPANNNYLPIHIKKNDDFLILGKVVEIRINL